jgi:hypothetical protein
MSLSVFDRIEDARARFRRDIADQFRKAAGKAGLAATVTMDRDRVVLQCDEIFEGGALPRFVAVFGEDGKGESDSVTLCVETEEGQNTLLRLHWGDEPGLDAAEIAERRLAELDSRTDEGLPLGRRGLNARADVRRGPYAAGDAIRHLAGDLKRASGQMPRGPDRSRALVPLGPAPEILPEAAERVGQNEDGGSGTLRAAQAGALEAQRANLTELLIARLMEAMQRDLAEAESHLVGPGMAASARSRFGRGMEWAMLGTAYGVEAQTNQVAVSAFLGSEAASWLYGLVGPVLIGGLASASKSTVGKGAAYGLMMAWAMAMATITASEARFLDHAQAFFPREAGVLSREHAVAAARVRKEAADAELNRLNAPLKETGSLVADAKKRWQAQEITREAKQAQELRDKARAQARQAAVAAGVALSDEELHLRQAMLSDRSRALAWWTLFAFFGVINLAGPLAISRVLERWRADHADAVANARDGHRKMSAAAMLRGARAAQSAHAMLRIPALLDGLKRDGVSPEAIALLDLADISQKAAERFDRGINGKRARRGLFGARGPAGGP